MSATETGGGYDADVIIIGAGPAGLPLASELVELGVDVKVVESGGWDPKEETTRLAEGDIIGYPYFPLDEARQRGVGGSSLRWFAYTRFRPFDSIDFEERPSIPNSGWPFGLEHLRPYYERAHEVLPLGPREYSTEYWERRDGAQRLPLPESEFETVVFQSIRGAHGNKSLAEIGTKLGDRLITNTTVTQLVVSDDGKRVDSIELARLDGHRSTMRARVFVLAAGGIDNPRMMLLSNQRISKGVGNQNDLVGRFFMEHPGVHSSIWVPTHPQFFDDIGLYLPHVVDDTRIMATLTLSDDVKRREGLLNASIILSPSDDLRSSNIYRSMAALSPKGFRPGRWPWSRYASDLGLVARHPVRSAATLIGVFNEKYPERRPVLDLDIDAEQVPNPDSRVTLGSNRDAFGLPRANLDWRHSELDMWSIRRTQELLRDSIRRAGMGDLERLLGEEEPPARVFGQRHHIGTTRIHVDPKRGVVDPNCKVHGMNNLFVTGSSVFPTSGYVNPTLTIIAMAFRMAAHLDQVLESRQGLA